MWRKSDSKINFSPDKNIVVYLCARKLAYWGCEIDTLTPEQHKYLFGE